MVKIGDFDIKMNDGSYNISWEGKDGTGYEQNYKNKKDLVARLRKLQPSLGKIANKLVNNALGIPKYTQKKGVCKSIKDELPKPLEEKKEDLDIEKVWKESWDDTQKSLNEIEKWGEKSEAVEKKRSDLRCDELELSRGLSERLSSIEVHINEIGERIGEIKLRQNEVSSYGVDIEKTSKRVVCIEKTLTNMDDLLEKLVHSQEQYACSSSTAVDIPVNKMKPHSIGEVTF